MLVLACRVWNWWVVLIGVGLKLLEPFVVKKAGLADALRREMDCVACVFAAVRLFVRPVVHTVINLLIPQP